MASSSRNNNGSFLFKSEKPQFFKIILPHSFTQHKLGIPPKFVRNHGDELSSPVILKAPSGQQWKVDIVKSEGEIWLEKGWQEFAEYYSVVEGYFLVFQYVKTNCEFNVTIFDMSATEIDYPFNLSDNVDTNLVEEQVPDEPNVVVHDSETDVSVEILSSKANLDQQTCATTLNRNGQAEVPIRQRKKLTNAEKAKAVPNLQTCGTPFNQNVQAEERVRQRKKLTKEDKVKAVEGAISNFHSDNPWFKVVMQPSYVYTNNGFGIRTSFPMKYLRKINGDAVLSTDGRSWSVKCYYLTCSGKICFKSFGWVKFVQDNDLEVGDVCIFELLPEYDETVFKVAISKYSDAGNSKQSKHKASCSKQKKFSPAVCPKRRRVGTACNITKKKIRIQHFVRTLSRDCPKQLVQGNKKSEARSDFSSGHHTFKIIMQRANFVGRRRYYLGLSRKFVKNMEQGTHKVKLQAGNKLWSVKLNIYPRRYVFGEGWMEFARQNSLKVGDECTFELIDSEVPLIGVSISRA